LYGGFHNIHQCCLFILFLSTSNFSFFLLNQALASSISPANQFGKAKLVNVSSQAL